MLQWAFIQGILLVNQIICFKCGGAVFNWFRKQNQAHITLPCSLLSLPSPSPPGSRDKSDSHLVSSPSLHCQHLCIRTDRAHGLTSCRSLRVLRDWAGARIQQHTKVHLWNTADQDALDTENNITKLEPPHPRSHKEAIDKEGVWKRHKLENTQDPYEEIESAWGGACLSSCTLSTEQGVQGHFVRGKFEVNLFYAGSYLKKKRRRKEGKKEGRGEKKQSQP